MFKSGNLTIYITQIKNVDVYIYKKIINQQNPKISPQKISLEPKYGPATINKMYTVDISDSSLTIIVKPKEDQIDTAVEMIYWV